MGPRGWLAVSFVCAALCASAAGCATRAPAPDAPAATQSLDPSVLQPSASEPGTTEPSSSEPSAVVAPAPRSPLGGSVTLRYRPRFTDGEQDHDAYALVALDYADPARPWLSAHVLGRVEADLDGDEDSPSVFGSLADTHDGSVVAQLYHAFVELERPDWIAALRAGRMVDNDTPEILHLDGVALTSKPLGEQAVEIGVYGGIPVHLYESSPEGDVAFGSSLEARPWKGGRMRLDWMHLEDEALLGAEEDDLFGLALWHALAQCGLLEARYTRLEDEDRDLLLRAQYAGAEGETIARANYYELLEPQNQRTLELDPFTTTMLEYFPFRQAGVIVSRMLSEKATVDLGFDMRRVTEEGDIGEFNRDWERYHATAALHDVFSPGLSFALTGERWDGGDQDVDTWGADVSFEPDDAWEVSLGSFFSLYKYDVFDASERDDVRTYLARGKYRWSEALALDLGYEFEDDDFEQYHVLRVGGTWVF